MSAALIQCTWDGEAFRPSSPFQARRAREAFGEGEVVVLSVEQERAMKSHRHYFAAIREAWANLPENTSLESWAQSPEHLRKYALIRSGFADAHTFVAGSAAEAARMAAFMRPMDEFSIVLAQGSTVTRYVAKSQSLRAMGAQDFKASKTAVLDLLAQLVGVAARDLEKAGEDA